MTDAEPLLDRLRHLDEARRTALETGDASHDEGIEWLREFMSFVPDALPVLIRRLEAEAFILQAAEAVHREGIGEHAENLGWLLSEVNKLAILCLLQGESET